MHPRSRIATCLAAVLLGAIVFLTGCVSQPAVVDYYMRSDYRISARDSDIVRPALDVVVLGGGPGYSSASYSGGNLWGRVRSRMGLGIPHNPRVDKEIRRLKSNPEYLEQLSARAKPYMHLIVREIEGRGLPAELALLPEIESKYNPKALSHKSASGMWQFIPDTGRKYGLKQNAWYDGRNDIVASTSAALDYLQWLHREFRGDWALALAGYNAGEGRVAAARRKNRSRGKGTDFWSLDLPSETEHYVPKLLAVAKLVEKPRRFGMRPPHIPNGPQLELVDTGRQMDLARAAKLSGVRLADLRRLNSGLKRGKTLPSGPHKLLVPIGSGRSLRAKSSKPQLRLPTVAQAGSKYRVREGDTLSKIASRHKVPVAALRKANGLKGDRVVVDKALIIPGKTPAARKSKTASLAERV